MKKITTAQELLESGILESYVLEQASPTEVALVEEMIAQFPEVKTAINDIATSFENYATANAVKPNETLKPFVMATLNYIGRMEAGEQPSYPPFVSDGAGLAEFEPWLSREDLQLKDKLNGTYAYIIGYTPQAITAIAWMEPKATITEKHDAEREIFLVVEGSCCITFNNTDHNLLPGQQLEIPLHTEHTVHITSNIPCKIILQRMPLAA